MALVKYLSSRRFCSAGLRLYASTIRFKNLARMMQPPRQIVAMSLRFRLHSCHCRASLDRRSSIPCVVRNDLGRIKGVAHRVDETIAITFERSSSRVRQNFRCRNSFFFSGGNHARFDCSVDCRNDDVLLGWQPEGSRCRFLFGPALSRITSTSGLPVSGSIF